MLKEYAIIVAGGSGTRFKSNIPKQFIEVSGVPILMRTLAAFHSYSNAIIIFLVLPENEFIFWENLCRLHDFKIPHQVVKGGSSRQQSVFNGLNAITEEGVVAIHDGVRPLLHKTIIENSFKTALQKGNAVAAMPLKDSIRIIENEENRSVDRKQYRLIQTPQTFLVSAIKNAYKKFMEEEFTDDAGIAERSGQKINLIEGSYDNIKITTAEDVLFAEAVLRNSSEQNT
ncbi:2-C-methyl-D-erythritol 4-phosphate cytidylyltransferase [soil metagenome]